jgi:hypothetical protein
VKRVAVAALVVAIASVAHADSPVGKEPCSTPDRPSKAPRCDEIADIESSEANLVSNEPRNGFTFAGSLGGGIMLGGDIGVGRGPVLSLRLGHVATRKTVITFEVLIPTALHQMKGVSGMAGPTLTDSNTSFLVGAQNYRSRSFWVRGAGGLTVLVKNAMTDGTGGDKPMAGIGGVVGAGLDIVRLRYPILGIEGMGMASLSRDGLKVLGGLSLGLSFY